MHLLQRRRLRRDITTVVFSCDEADLSRFAVRSGPCVALEPARSPLVSPLRQDDGETPELTAALYTALTGQSGADALRPISHDGRGTLSQCSQHFVEAMAAYVEQSLQLADDDEARGDEDLPSFSQHQDALSDAWMRAGRWPRAVLAYGRDRNRPRDEEPDMGQD